MRNGCGGIWTSIGHYIVIRGYTDKGLYVNDPNGPSNYKKHSHAKTLNDHINTAHSWADEFKESVWAGNRARYGICWVKKA